MTAQRYYQSVSLAILLGMASVLVETIFLSPLVLTDESYTLAKALALTTIVYLTAGLVFGLIRGLTGVLWGILIAAPSFVVLLIGILFTWIFTNFLTQDLPLIVASFLAPILGTWLGALFKSYLRIGRKSAS